MAMRSDVYDDIKQLFVRPVLFQKWKELEFGFQTLETYNAFSCVDFFADMYQFIDDLFKKIELEERSLLIKEDASFVNHLISQSDKKSIKSCRTFTALKISIISGLAVGGLSFMAHVTNFGVVDVAAVSGASLSLYFIGNRLITSYHLNTIQNQLMKLCRNLADARTVIKKLLIICQEAEAIEKKNQEFNKSASLKINIATGCSSYFETVRQSALRVRQELPLPFSDSANESSSLSSLPIETFSDLLNNEHVLTVTQLKSLSQLIRLQISELLRRVFCGLLFSASSEINNQELKNISKKLSSIVADFLKISEPIVTKLLSFKTYYEALWNTDPVECRQPTVADNHDFLLCAQTAQTSLRSSLARLHYAIESSCNDESKKLDICDILDQTVNELTETVDLLKTFQIHSLKDRNESNSKEIIQVTPEQSNQIDVKDVSDVEEIIQDYEVFEDSNLQTTTNDEICNIDDEWDVMKTIGLSVNLNQELKDALLIKAMEHRKRVSNALGVPLLEVPSQLLDNNSLNSVGDNATIDQPTDREVHSQRRHDLHQTQSMLFNLPSHLANVAAMKSQNFGSHEVECFGDEESDFENDEG